MVFKEFKMDKRKFKKNTEKGDKFFGNEKGADLLRGNPINWQSNSEIIIELTNSFLDAHLISIKSDLKNEMYKNVNNILEELKNDNRMLLVAMKTIIRIAQRTEDCNCIKKACDAFWLLKYDSYNFETKANAISLIAQEFKDSKLIIMACDIIIKEELEKYRR
ncbi:MAG: hypothetical protein WC356_04685 [Candidatus Micrarchaeia archaeon]|jgi:hypothetical protein